MRTEFMRRVDRWLGKVALWGSTYWGPFFRKVRPATQRVVIAKFFGLGSIIHTYRLLDALYSEGYEVAFLTFSANVPFLRKLKGVQHTFGIDPTTIHAMATSSWRVVRAMNHWAPNTYIDLELFSYYSAIMGVFSNAPTRIAFFSAIRPRRFYMTHRIRWNPFFHVSRNYLEFARPLVSQSTFKNAARRFTAEEIFQTLPSRSPINSPYIVLAPFASDTLAGLKMWPIAHWQTLIEYLGNAYPEFPLVIIGTHNDLCGAAELLQNVRHPALINQVGKTTLEDLYALVAHASLTIAIDSFPFHLSTLLGRPTIGLFGPETPIHYGSDDQPHSMALSSGIMCSPCINVYAGKVSELLCTDNQCLQRIRPETVMEIIQRRKILAVR